MEKKMKCPECSKKHISRSSMNKCLSKIGNLWGYYRLGPKNGAVERKIRRRINNMKKYETIVFGEEIQIKDDAMWEKIVG